MLIQLHCSSLWNYIVQSVCAGHNHMLWLFYLCFRSSYNGHPTHVKYRELRREKWTEKIVTPEVLLHTMSRTDSRWVTYLFSTRPTNKKILAYLFLNQHPCVNILSIVNTILNWCKQQKPLVWRSKEWGVVPDLGLWRNMRPFTVLFGLILCVSVFLLPLCNRICLT